ncbi:MAG: cellulase family glycosylhydrolase [Fimbriimonas sp.]|nr:cellulase family glycosylhydrolase [Fimbriimonas sp.]
MNNSRFKFLASAVAIGTVPLAAFGSLPSGKPLMLPPGYLRTRGSQIVDAGGHPVRIACMGGFGTDIVGGRLDYDNGPFHGVDANIEAVKRFGFNCIRVDFNDKNVSDPVVMGQFDTLVSTCRKYGVRVIFDNHNNEATAQNWGNAAQQSNGIWFDAGPGSDGTDGAGNTGTISDDLFTQDWIAMAKRYAGDPTVIGFDLRNEPVAHYNPRPPVWGGGGPRDIHAMYERVGNAIQKVNPGALIICEAIINWEKGAYAGDLTPAKAMPVKLRVPAKVVYSLHEYSWDKVDVTKKVLIPRLNKTWGFLVRENIAPVWIGEMGATGSPSDKRAIQWDADLLAYLNGEDGDLGGPVFRGQDQPVSADLWRWGCQPETEDGCMNHAGEIRPEIAEYASGQLFTRRPIPSSIRRR